MKYCKASKETRIKEMIDSPAMLRNLIKFDEDEEIPQELLDKIDRYETAAEKLV